MKKENEQKLLTAYNEFAEANGYLPIFTKSEFDKIKPKFDEKNVEFLKKMNAFSENDRFFIISKEPRSSQDLMALIQTTVGTDNLNALVEKINGTINLNDADSVIRNFDNLDDYVLALMIDELENNSADYIGTWTSELNLNMFERENSDGVLFYSTYEEEKFFGHFVNDILKVYTDFMQETGVSNIDVDGAIVETCLEVCGRIIDQFYKDNSDHDVVIEEDLKNFLKTLKSLKSSEIDFIN